MGVTITTANPLGYEIDYTEFGDGASVFWLQTSELVFMTEYTLTEPTRVFRSGTTENMFYARGTNLLNGVVGTSNVAFSNPSANITDEDLGTEGGLGNKDADDWIKWDLGAAYDDIIIFCKASNISSTKVYVSSNDVDYTEVDDWNTGGDNDRHFISDCTGNSVRYIKAVLQVGVGNANLSIWELMAFETWAEDAGATGIRILGDWDIEHIWICKEYTAATTDRANVQQYGDVGSLNTLSE